MPVPSSYETSLRGILSALRNVDIKEDLIRSDLGQFSFDAERPIFEAIRETASLLETLAVERIERHASGNELREALQEVLRLYQRINALDLKSAQDVHGIHRNMVEELHVRSTEAQRTFERVAGALILYGGGLSNYQSALDQALRDLQSEATARVERMVGRAQESLEQVSKQSLGIMEEIESARESATAAASKAQAAAAASGVGRYASEFKNEAAAQRRNAKYWFIAGIASLGLLVIVAIAFVAIGIDDSEAITSASQIQVLLLKALVLSVGSYATLTLFRMFRVQRHLAEANQHRHLALLTFQEFASGALDDQTKDAVLIEATRAVFAQSQTGLVDEGSHSASGLSLLEIVRSSNRPSS